MVFLALLFASMSQQSSMVRTITGEGLVAAKTTTLMFNDDTLFMRDGKMAEARQIKLGDFVVHATGKSKGYVGLVVARSPGYYIKQASKNSDCDVFTAHEKGRVIDYRLINPRQTLLVHAATIMEGSGALSVEADVETFDGKPVRMRNWQMKCDGKENPSHAVLVVDGREINPKLFDSEKNESKEGWFLLENLWFHVPRARKSMVLRLPLSVVEEGNKEIVEVKIPTDRCVSEPERAY